MDRPEGPVAKKILLVDDEPSMIKLVGRRLEEAGYQVLPAIDGQEAVDKARAERPDLIVLDVMLPKINGYSVCAILKTDARYAQIPIVMLTAKAQQKDEALGRTAGADVYIRKPFKSQELLDAIAQLLQKAGER